MESTATATTENAATTSPVSPVTEPVSPVSVVCGIDFGTNGIVMSFKQDNDPNLPYIVHNNLSNDFTPAIVSFKKMNERLVGEEALNMFVSQPKATVAQLKRILGMEKLDEMAEERKRLAYSFVEEEGKAVAQLVSTNGSVSFTPEELTSMILLKLDEFLFGEYKAKNREQTFGKDQVEITKPAAKYVIAVPPSFSDQQRVALLDAAKIAGLDVASLVHDVTAAAICYGVQKLGCAIESTPATPPPTPVPELNKKILIINMGASYFTAQVMHFTKHKIEVLSSVSDAHLGAREFEHSMFDYAIEQFKATKKIDLRGNPKAMNRILRACEKCKQLLSTLNESELIVEAITNDMDLHFKITRALFEDLNKDVIAKLTQAIEKVLADAKVQPEELDAVELVGGGVRIPIVQATLKAALKNRDFNFGLSSHSTAFGSAIYAKTLEPNSVFKLEVVDPFFKSNCVSKISDSQLEKSVAKNRELVNKEIEVKAIHAKKNELETFIYNKKTQLDDSKYTSYVSSEEKAQIKQILQESEEWVHSLYDEELNMDTLSTRLAQIQEQVSKIAPKLHEVLVKEAEEKQKALQEALEYAKHYQPVHKERDEPRTNAEKIEAAKKKKNLGNVCFKDGDFENAISRYNQAVQFLSTAFDLSPQLQTEVNEIKVSCHLNNSAAWLKLQKYERARDSGTEVIRIDPNNVKALFRRGQAYYYLKDFENAKEDLTNAAKIEPNNADVKKTLAQVTQQLQAQKEKEKKMYSKMFA